MAFPFVSLRRLSTLLRRVAPLRWALKAAVRLIAPTHCVGAVVAVFDDDGRVLLVEHVFRTDYPWGLPGGWVSRGEAPAAAVAREVWEELRLEIEVRELICAERVPATRMANHPSHIGLAYYARLRGGTGVSSAEVLSLRWADPAQIDVEMAPFQRSAVNAARAAHARENGSARPR
jgi:ADP-ribose pyrophosphatase YjhB (NUDIX family)